MVSAVIDPIRIPTLNLSSQELDELASLIEQGQLPKDFLDRHFDAVDANVFGIDAPKDRHGNRKEQGIGSAGNQTANSVAAYIKYCKNEPDYDENVKRMKAELAKCEEARKAQVTAANRKRAKRIGA